MASATWYSRTSTLYCEMNVWIAETGSDYHDLGWDCYFYHWGDMTKRDDSQASHFYIDGNEYIFDFPRIYSGQGNYVVSTYLGSGRTRIYHSEGRTVNFSFNIQWSSSLEYSRVYYSSMYADGSIWLDQLAVPPEPPNSITVTNKGGWGGFIDIDNPICDVSWSGAQRGTYEILNYNIDFSKNNFVNIVTPFTSEAHNSTEGSATNVNFSELGLSGGDQVRLRVAMWTTWNQWQFIYWDGYFTVASHPTAPQIYSPTTVEIDTSFSINWSGATAGTRGITGYDFEVRGFNGTSWSDWYSVFNEKNQLSYTAGTPKSIVINGVNYYSSYGEKIKFQYRVRTTDGMLTSDWVYSNEISTYINSPTIPRK